MVLKQCASTLLAILGCFCPHKTRLLLRWPRPGNMSMAALQTRMLIAQTGNPSHLTPHHACLSAFKNNYLYQKHTRSLPIGQLRAAPNPGPPILQHKAPQVHPASHTVPCLCFSPNLLSVWPEQDQAPTYSCIPSQSQPARPAVAGDGARPVKAWNGLKVIVLSFRPLSLWSALSFCLGSLLLFLPDCHLTFL